MPATFTSLPHAFIASQTAPSTVWSTPVLTFSSSIWRVSAIDFIDYLLLSSTNRLGCMQLTDRSVYQLATLQRLSWIGLVQVSDFQLKSILIYKRRHSFRASRTKHSTDWRIAAGHCKGYTCPIAFASPSKPSYIAFNVCPTYPN